jgi:hypothetical protein
MIGMNVSYNAAAGTIDHGMLDYTITTQLKESQEKLLHMRCIITL